MTTEVDITPLWTIHDIAGFYRRSLRTAHRLVRRDGFPPPTPTDPGRWVAAQVVAHAQGMHRPGQAQSQTLAASSRPGRRIERRKKVTA